MKLCLAFVLALAFSASCFGQIQNLQYGSKSEASRSLTAMQRGVQSATQAQQMIALDKGVDNGFGLGVMQPRLGTNKVNAAPRRAQPATFGAPIGEPRSKPFSGISSAPTVSPYMNLFNDSITGDNDFNYQTLVRPQLQQQQFNSQVQRQASQLNQRMSALSARNDYNITGNQEVMPTGHSATFGYHSRFYPALGQRRR